MPHRVKERSEECMRSLVKFIEEAEEVTTGAGAGAAVAVRVPFFVEADLLLAFCVT